MLLWAQRWTSYPGVDWIAASTGYICCVQTSALTGALDAVAWAQQKTCQISKVFARSLAGACSVGLQDITGIKKFHLVHLVERITLLAYHLFDPPNKPSVLAHGGAAEHDRRGSECRCLTLGILNTLSDSQRTWPINL